MEAANLPTFLKFGNAKKSDICVNFAKKSWVATKLGAWSKSGRACATGPDLKPPLPTNKADSSSQAYRYIIVTAQKRRGRSRNLFC